MATGNLVKNLQNIMRQDPGVNGDAQRIEQMVWLFFLKVYDAQEEDWECDDDDFKSIIPERMKVKLILIDTHQNIGELAPMRYFIDCENTTHIDRWRYSPECSGRIIETVF